MIHSLKKIIITVALVVICSMQIIASENDSIKPKIDSTAVFYYLNNVDSIYIPKLFLIDTCLNGVQKYDPLRKWHKYYQSLGNIGLAYDRMLFSPTPYVGFDYGIHSFDEYLFTNENTKSYKTIIPYTDIVYVMGRNKEHFLKVTHTQNIKRNLSIGLDFRLINSPGFYASQKSDNSSIVFSTKYSSNNKRYNILAKFLHNGVKVQENGGIENDSAFDYNQEANRRIIEVNLNDAMRRIKETEVYVQNSYNLSKNPTPVTDTNHTQDLLNPKLFNPGNISYTFTFNRKLIIYEDQDPTSGFYPVINHDSLLTHDSTAIIKFENQIAWSNFDNYDQQKSNFLNAAFGLTMRNIKLSDDSSDHIINQLALSAKATKSFLKKFIVYLDADYIIGDYNNGDHLLKGQINWLFGNDTVNEKLVVFKLGYNNQEPAFLYQHHYSNNFIWNNDLGKQQVLSSNLSLRVKNFTAQINYYNINSFLYFNLSALPEQSDNSINVITASVFKSFILGKFQLDNEVVYQYDGRSDVLRLPDLILNHSVYLNLDLFRRAVSTQTGVDIFYNTAYYANSYMPATAVFYLQNDKKTGNYVYVDFFVNFKIKRAMIFAKYEHINKGLFNSNYYMTPHYPMPDGAFKFGVKWRFYN